MIHNLPLFFETGKFKGNPRFLEDEEYARALDCLVKGCCDILITNGSIEEDNLRFFLGKRCVHPQKDWWYPTGGRMKPGETPLDTAKRIIKRELGLSNLKEENFSLIGYYCYAWEMRQQEPQSNGTADISCVLAFVLDPCDLETYKADEKEYQEHKWISFGDLKRSEYNPALIQSIDDYVKRLKLNKIKKLAQDNTYSDAAVGKLFREFVRET